MIAFLELTGENAMGYNQNMTKNYKDVISIVPTPDQVVAANFDISSTIGNPIGLSDGVKWTSDIVVSPGGEITKQSFTLATFLHDVGINYYISNIINNPVTGPVNLELILSDGRDQSWVQTYLRAMRDQIIAAAGIFQTGLVWKFLNNAELPFMQVGVVRHANLRRKVIPAKIEINSFINENFTK